MAPPKRRPASIQRAPIDIPASRAPVDTPESQERVKMVPTQSTPLLGPAGEPIAQEAPTGVAAGEDPAPPREAGQVDRGDEAARQSQGRSRALHPERIWPD